MKSRVCGALAVLVLAAVCPVTQGKTQGALTDAKVKTLLKCDLQRVKTATSSGEADPVYLELLIDHSIGDAAVNGAIPAFDPYNLVSGHKFDKIEAKPDAANKRRFFITTAGATDDARQILMIVGTGDAEVISSGRKINRYNAGFGRMSGPTGYMGKCVSVEAVDAGKLFKASPGAGAPPQ